MDTDSIKVTGYRNQEHLIRLGDYVADENGRGGRVVSVSFDTQLNEYVIDAVPKEGPAYQLRGSQISFTAPPDPDEV